MHAYQPSTLQSTVVWTWKNKEKLAKKIKDWKTKNLIKNYAYDDYLVKIQENFQFGTWKRMK